MTESSETTQAEAAWLAYRDQYQRERPWGDSRRLARQMRKRDFIAGYLAAISPPPGLPERQSPVPDATKSGGQICDCGSWDGAHEGDCSIFRVTTPPAHSVTVCYGICGEDAGHASHCAITHGHNACTCGLAMPTPPAAGDGS